MNGLPDVERKALVIDTMIDDYVDNHVRPYCQRLLAKAQARCHRHRLGFVDGMGTMFVTVDGEPHHGLTDDCCLGPASGYAKRFPELVELLAIAFRLDEYPFHRELGDLA